MQIYPILSALRFHRIATLLIALQIALACAVLCNACFMIITRVHMMHLESGVDESSLAVLSINGYEPDQSVDLNARMLAGLRSVPGIQSVSLINAVPFGVPVGTTGIFLDSFGRKR